MEASVGRRNGWKSKGTVKTIIIAAIVIVAALAAGLAYRQIVDYHDAKYRAQYVIVGGMPNLISDATDATQGLLNKQLTLDSRCEDGWDAERLFECLETSVRSIQVMYLNDDEKFEPLLHFQNAIFRMYHELYYATDALWGSLSAPSQELTPATWAALNSSMNLFLEIRTIVIDSFDDETNGLEHPYSLVNRMDLKTLSEKSTAILDILSLIRV